MSTRLRTRVTLSAGVLSRFMAGKYVYRGFGIRRIRGKWRIVGADGDHSAAFTLRDAMQKINRWYHEGLVE